MIVWVVAQGSRLRDPLLTPEVAQNSCGVLPHSSSSGVHAQLHDQIHLGGDLTTSGYQSGSPYVGVTSIDRIGSAQFWYAQGYDRGQEESEAK